MPARKAAARKSPANKSTKATTKKAAKGAKKSRMSDSHKSALAEGRRQGAMVRLYLEALETHRPKRGRKRTPDSIKKRLAVIDASLPNASSLERLHLTQERMNLSTELERLSTKVGLKNLEDDFVKAAAGYSSRKGISYAAWREAGVSPEVLRRAGIGRGD